MSHSATIDTEFKCSEEASLIDALKEVFGDNVEVHSTPAALKMWNGSNMGDTANVIVRHEHLKGCVNDLGFKRGADGKYQVNADNHTVRDFMADIKKSYAVNTSSRFLKTKGYSLKKEVQEDGTVVIVGTKF